MESTESMQQTNGKNENSKGTTSMSSGAPKGYKKRSTGIVGSYEPSLGGVHIVPLFVKLFDGNIDPKKPSCLIVCRLVDATDAVTTKGWEKDQPGIHVKAGEQIGVWYKPGMSDILSLGGEECYLEYERDDKGKVATKKIPGKPSPMPLFSVTTLSNVTRQIPVVEDTRRLSAHVDTPFTKAKSAEPLPGPAPDSVDDSSEEFNAPPAESDIAF